MRESDLFLGVLATQAGFVSASQVMEAAAALLRERDTRGLGARLEESGALTARRRLLLEGLTAEALEASKGDAGRLLSALGGEAALSRTFGSSALPPAPEPLVRPDSERAIPVEREGQYTRLDELGRGAQSVVRRGVDEFVGREVALKELLLLSEATPPVTPTERAAMARFIREARLTAQLDHPAIVTVYELARRADGNPVCAQKLIRGMTLKAKLKSCESLTQRLDLLPHVVDACQAMAYAHSRGVLHRDLKPSNIMVGAFGETVVVDWGLAKKTGEPEAPGTPEPPPPPGDLTLAGIALGTPSYMSPEQARGALAEIDERSDVFSLGGILYELITGRVPFEGTTREQILENVLAGRCLPVRALAPDAPPELAAIAERALRPEPAERYPDAEALARDLAEFLAGGRVRAYRYGALELARRFASGHPALTAGLAVALGALLVSAAVVAVRLQAARRYLAHAFVERAYAAERQGDWTQAAAYFAAARVQRDVPEARWGAPLAAELATERILALHGPAESFTDVGVLADGRVITLGLSGNRVEVREVESGKTLWFDESEPVLAAALLPGGGQVRLTLGAGWAFHDAATGKQLGMYDRTTDGRPCPGPFPTPAVILRGALLLRSEGKSTRPLAADAALTQRCLVSDDGRQVAYQDASETVRLLALDDGRTLASHPGRGLQSMAFTRHGLVLIVGGRLHVFGGPAGAFTIELPEGGLGASTNDLGGSAVSPDGHLVVVARLGSNRADVVDLQSRSIRGILHYAPGWPRFAVSLDNQRVFAAGLQYGATLSGWRLPLPDVPTTHQGLWGGFGVFFSSRGTRLLFYDRSSAPPHYELYGAGGELLASGAHPVGVEQFEFAGDGPVVAASDLVGGEVVTQDLERNQVLWKRACRYCRRFGISGDGSRVVWVGLDGLEVWDTRADRMLFKEAERVGRIDTLVTVSPDGRRVAWTRGATAIVRELDSGLERTLPLDGAERGLRFGPDSTRLAAVTTGSIAVLDAVTARSLWSVANSFPDKIANVFWSPDARALVLEYQTLGTEVLDAGTGERLARFLASNSISPARVFVQPDLRAKVVMTNTHWERRPLAQPDTESPDRRLRRTLEKTGLALSGIELVAAP